MPSPKRIAGQGVIRSRSHQIVAWLLAAICLIVVISGIAVGVGKSDPGPQLILAAVFAVLCVYCARNASSAIIALPSATTVIVKNPLSTHEIAWSEIEGFELAKSWLTSGRGNTRQIIKVKLKSGKRITCAGVSPWGFTAALDMHRDLNRLAGEARLSAAR